MNRYLLVLSIVFSFSGALVAQRNLSVNANPGSTPVAGKLYYAGNNEAPRAIEFEDGVVSTASFMANINQYLNIPSEFTFTEVESNTDQLGMRHYLLQQYYQGIPLEGLVYRVHEKNGFVRSANGRAARNINLNNTQTILSEQQAFVQAKMILNSNDTVRSSGKLLITSKDFKFTPESFTVAYQFDIRVSFVERWRVTIDARTGKVVNKVSLIKSCFDDEDPPLPYSRGTGFTKYYGHKDFLIEKTGTKSSRMVGRTNNGVQITTYTFRGRPAEDLIWRVSNGDIIVSSDTIFNDKAAVSVQWGLERSLEYYLDKHGRNGYNDKGYPINSYVHVGSNYDNAFWTGTELAFGDGSNNNPLVQLEVIGHELTHGVTEWEADLIYQNEPGALNESFSDIFGKAIEFEEFGDTTGWILAKSFRPGGLRNMANPNLQTQPDTYNGDLWYTGTGDYGGVHYNSGVQNFWYYLLCVGGSGVNDNDDSYSVDAIGMEAATKIAYRNLSEYLSYTSDYVDSRIGSMLSARDLYGKNSFTYQQVDNAWEAVGVSAQPIVLTFGFYDITATTVKINGTLQPRGDTVTYHFEYGTTPALGMQSQTFTYIDKIEGQLTGLQPSTKYYVKLVASNEFKSGSYSSTFTTIALNPMVKIRRTIDVSETTANLNGFVNANSLPTTCRFEYGLTTALGSFTPTVSAGTGTEFDPTSATITNLQPRTTYYYRIVAQNASGIAASPIESLYTAAKPVITSFSPTTAVVNTEITIVGSNFNSSPEKNQVNFGATRAMVISATTSEIKVKVPGGASLGPISVLDIQSGLIGESIEEFVPTYTGEFNKGSMQLRMGIKAESFYDNNNYIYNALVEDMDGDGRPDVVVRHFRGFSVFQNVNQGEGISDESFVRNIFSSQLNSYTQSLVDFDGNGLKDVVMTYEMGVMKIFPNYSVPGFIFFGAPIDLPADFNDIIFADFDSDGHIDIGATRPLPESHTEFIVLRNFNPKGVLEAANFEQQFSIVLSDYIYNLYSDDLNNDGKPDIIAGVSNKNYVSILRNTSGGGVLSFVPNNVLNYGLERNPRFLTQDLNQDGWKDLASFSSGTYSDLALIENKGTSSTISTEPALVALTGYQEDNLQAGDVDGDGKIDLLLGTNDGMIMLLKNKLPPDGRLTASSFEKIGEYGTASVDFESHPSLVVNDLNNDGRPEVISTFWYNRLPGYDYRLTIWQNSNNDCIDPASIKLNVGNYDATIVLPPDASIDDLEMWYRAQGSTSWWRVYSNKIYSLTPGYGYQFRVRAKCYLGYTEYHQFNFTTECVNTSSFAISGISANAVTVSATDLGSFEIGYSIAGKDEWVSVPRYQAQITNLIAGTHYEIRYRGICPVPSEYKYKTFTTTCPDLTSLSVVDITHNSALVTWTSNYPGTAIIEYSADNANWIKVEDQVISSLTPGKQYFVRALFKCTDLVSGYIYKTFVTNCPQLSSLTVDALTPFSARINWVDDTQTNNYKVTYFSGINGSLVTVQTNTTFLDISGLTAGTNYTVTVTPDCFGADIESSISFTTICYVPFNLLVSDVGYTSAELSWEDDFGTLPYHIDYAVTGTHDWKTTVQTAAGLSLTQLRPATEYEVRVRITCVNKDAPYASQFFETKAYATTTFGPNPTDGKLTIHPSKDLIGNLYTLVDNAGRIVAQGVMQGYTFDMSGLSSGLYILKIEGEDPMKIFKHHR